MTQTVRGKYNEWITPEGLLTVEGWARDGLVDDQIAHNIGIVRSTLYAWKKKYPEFDAALKKGKEIVDREVENTLLRRAHGYEYEEVVEVEEDGKIVRIERRRRTALPDTTSLIFWLKNRKPEQWRDKSHVEMTGSLELAERAALFEKYVKEDD